MTTLEAEARATKKRKESEAESQGNTKARVPVDWALMSVHTKTGSIRSNLSFLLALFFIGHVDPYHRTTFFKDECLSFNLGKQIRGIRGATAYKKTQRTA